jgi:uncharacterized protein YkvS
MIDTVYDKPFLYCFNTTSKIIQVGNYVFSDWDEMILDNSFCKKSVSVIVGGFQATTLIKMKNGFKKRIRNIKIGDILEKGEKVTGVVETVIGDHYLLDLGIHGKINAGGNLSFLSHLDKKKNKIKNKVEKPYQEKKLFHLLTDTQTFHIKKVIFYDYNACLDRILEKK